MNIDNFMEGCFSSHGSFEGHLGEDYYGNSGDYLSEISNRYSPISFDIAVRSAGQASFHQQMSSENVFDPGATFTHYDPVLWNDLATRQYDLDIPKREDIASSGRTNQQDSNSLRGNIDGYLEYCAPPSEISISSPEDETDDTVNKPYARLIYEALMQAPGHRMLLREIYDWFAENTCKTQGSSVNGWQNSIRHNLSMNQAFENDKKDQTGCQSGKKVNSVWFLTEDAIENGVQSTTRFRKTGPPKRSQNPRINQTRRQRSGMKGGKATKRSLALRKQGSTTAYRCITPSMNQRKPDHHGSLAKSLSHATYHSGNYPVTPASDLIYEHVYGLPHWEVPEEMQGIKREIMPEDAKDYLHGHLTNTRCGNLMVLQHESPSFGHVLD